MQHADRVVQQLIPRIDLGNHAHAILGDGMIYFGFGLQPQIVNEKSVPGRDDMKTFFSQFTSG